MKFEETPVARGGGKSVELLKRAKLKNLITKHPLIPTRAIPKPKYSDKTSNGLTKCIIDWITLDGGQAERINSTGRLIDGRKTTEDVIGRKRTVGSSKWIKSSGKVGTADVSATVNGKSIKVEVKCASTKDNVQSKEQLAYQREVESAGGGYIIARTLDGFVKQYNDKIKG